MKEKAFKYWLHILVFIPMVFIAVGPIAVEYINSIPLFLEPMFFFLLPFLIFELMTGAILEPLIPHTHDLCDLGCWGSSFIGPIAMYGIWIGAWLMVGFFVARALKN